MHLGPCSECIILLNMAGNLISVVQRVIPWRRKWQPTPVFFPGESHGKKNTTGRKELDTTEAT